MVKSEKYLEVVDFIMKNKSIDYKILKNTFDLNGEEARTIINKLKANKVIGLEPVGNRYMLQIAYDHQAFLNPSKLKEAIKVSTPTVRPKKRVDPVKQIKRHNFYQIAFFILTVLVVFLTCFWAVRADTLYLLFSIPVQLAIFVYSYQYTSNTIFSFIGASIFSLCFLLFINAKEPIFGEKYKEQKENSERVEKANAAVEEEKRINSIKIANSRGSILNKLLDPKSASFFGEKVSNISGSGVTCGFVSSNNHLGGKVTQRYVASLSPGVAFIEEEVKDFDTVWNQYCN
ncbi:hypothetical protein [Thorsellia kenyensis]|uniref:Uncharacterized protein n=1 Tax=Thorsellia kenyensis TaxID=1549888 RepID=A0ABV6C7R3_9GAMM